MKFDIEIKQLFCIMNSLCDLSSVWLEHHLDMVGVGGSSPLGRTKIISFHKIISFLNFLFSTKNARKKIQNIFLRSDIRTDIKNVTSILLGNLKIDSYTRFFVIPAYLCFKFV